MVIPSKSLYLHQETIRFHDAQNAEVQRWSKEEIAVKAILKSNDIQPLEEGLRFLVAPLKIKGLLI